MSLWTATFWLVFVALLIKFKDKVPGAIRSLAKSYTNIVTTLQGR